MVSNKSRKFCIEKRKIMSAPPILTLRQGSLAFGNKQIFKDLSFSVNSGDKICLVGRNGCGKSTLMKVLAGDIEIDDGELFIQPGTRFGYLPQQINYSKNSTIYDFVLHGLDGDSDKYMADMLLSPFDLDGNMVMDTLSGGELRRVGIARAFINDPDIVLLDEPTNHLDIGAINWLEDYIGRFAGAIICISHDRTFLKNISRKTLWMHQNTMLTNKQGYGDFERWSEFIFEQEEKSLKKLGKEVSRENNWLQRGVTARRKRNVQRLDKLFYLRDKLKKDKSQFNKNRTNVKLPELSPQLKSKMIVEMENINKSFGDRKIISDFTMRIMKGDRIGIIGKNGSGKTTLLKIITGDYKQDSGFLRRGIVEVKFRQQITYFEQDRSSLNMEKTPWQVLCPDGGDTVFFAKGHRHVVAYLKDFMFTPDQTKSPVSSLSGGEANRLMLAKILTKPGDILILDEPTNDLDVETLDMLQELLDNYKGTLIIVSHDRDFIDKIVTKTIVFEGGGDIVQCAGGYSDYLEYKKAQESKKKPQTAAQNKPNNSQKVVKSSKAAKKMSFKDEHDLKTLPGEIDSLHEEVASINQKLSDPNLYIEDPDAFDKLTKNLERKKLELVGMEDKLIELEILREDLENS